MQASLSKPGIFLRIAAIVVAVLALRHYDAFITPQLYAEDGRVFLQEYANNGIASLFRPYAGYLHTIPRLVAILWGTLRVDYLYLPACYNLSALLITYAVCIYLWQCAVKLQSKQPVAFAVAFLLLPLDSEIYMNLTNTVWLTALPIIAYLLITYTSQPPQQSGPIAMQLPGYIILLILSLTGPCSLLVSPVIIFMLLTRMRSFSPGQILSLLIICIGGLVQFICIKFIDPDVQRSSYQSNTSDHLLKLFAFNVRDLFFLDDPCFINVPESVLLTICMVIFAALLFIFSRLYIRSSFAQKHILLFVAVIYFLSFVWAYWPNESNVLALHSARYYFISYTCLAWIIITAAPVHRALMATYFAFMAFHMPLVRFELPDKNWKGELFKYRLGLNTNLDINPGNWTVELPAIDPPFKKVDYNDFDKKYLLDKVIPLWSANPAISNPVPLPQGRFHFKIISTGSAAATVYPHINIYVNDIKIGDFNTAAELTSSPAFTFDHTDENPVTIKMNMDNDALIDGHDRNAFIHMIVIDKAPR